MGGFVLEEVKTMYKEYVDYLVITKSNKPTKHNIEMQKLVALADRRGIKVVEDNWILR